MSTRTQGNWWRRLRGWTPAGLWSRGVRGAGAPAPAAAGPFDGLPDAYFELGPDGRIVCANAVMVRLTGYSAAELQRMRIEDLEVADGAPPRVSPAGRSGRRFQASLRRRDGDVVHVEASIGVHTQAGRLSGLLRDISAGALEDQRLRRSEARYRTLVELSRDLIWSIDHEGRWTFVNAAARTIYGYEPTEMLGRSVLDFVAPARRLRAEQTLAELRAGAARVRYETEHVRRDGTTVTLHVNATPLRNDAGDVIGATGSSTDVSSWRRTEARLHEARGRFERLVATMPLGYIVWSRDFHVMEWNPGAAAIFGFAEVEALGRGAAELIIAPGELPAFTAMTRDVLKGDAGAAAVLSCRRKSGEVVRCEWYNTVLPDSGGGVEAVATLVRDVSERERLEAQLQQAQKLESLGVLAGGVAHDFNNFLVGIIGNASLALDGLPPESPLRGPLERVVNAGRRATALTQRMLAYAGRSTCCTQVMDLNELVAELAIFASAAIPKQVSVSINTAMDLPSIEADSGQLQQVVMNLLINAAEAIGDRAGRVGVATWAVSLDAARIAAEFPQHALEPGDYVVLEVRDNGCGIADEVRERIFEPFFTTKFAGRGLGLSAILGIVRAHRGAIVFDSAPGEGTTFRVYLPAATSARPPAIEAAAPGVLPRGATVLVIDDEEDVRDVVEAVLSRRGVNVIKASDGASGVELYRRSMDSIDVVLLDLNMPGMNGEQVFHALRALRSDARVVLSTGFSQQEAALRFANAPIAGFIHKPYTASSLVERLADALHSGRPADEAERRALSRA